jgi:hypothetical protein
MATGKTVTDTDKGKRFTVTVSAFGTRVNGKTTNPMGRVHHVKPTVGLIILASGNMGTMTDRESCTTTTAY